MIFEFLIGLFSFVIIALAAKQIGQLFKYFNLPLISGFLFTGIIAGPFLIQLISVEAVKQLHFIDEIALAFIAFTAGSELFLKELKHYYRSIIWITIGLITFTLSIGALTFMWLAKNIPFIANMSTSSHLAIALLVGTVLVTRSPSAAIAIINELRAKGPFTKTILGVIVIIDVAVIILFALNVSIANMLLTNNTFELRFILEIGLELSLALVLGYLLTQLLVGIMTSRSTTVTKIIAILTLGYFSFWTTKKLNIFAHNHWHFELHIEPLLVCMLAGFLLTNFSNYRNEFSTLIRNCSLPVYVAFFTLTGASLELDVLKQTWLIALTLFGTRVISSFLGAFIGGVISREPWSHNSVRGLGFITQAGVGLGLAKELASNFPDWGPAIATIIISVIILNELFGPLCFKLAINLVGESHVRARASASESDGVQNALIFGLERQSFVLARQLQAHHWQVKIAGAKDKADNFVAEDIEIAPIDEINLESLNQLDAKHVDAIVCLQLSDDKNYKICELVFEHFGIDTVVVRLNDHANFKRFQELGALVVDPSTATVQLLEEFVRSPSTTSLLLGMANQDIMEIEITDPELHHVPLRDLRLPLDTLVLSVRRHGKVLISHGYTQLELNDRVTVVGSEESLNKVMLRFGLSSGSENT